VAVEQHEQRQGIGTALVNNSTAVAPKREGIHKVALVVFGKNEKGNAFWEKQDFAIRTDLLHRNTQ